MDEQSRKLEKLKVNASYDEEKEGETKTLSDWVIKIKDIVEQKKSYPSGRSCTIYKLTACMHNVQESAFIQKVISIGPFHRERDTMMDHKTRYLLRLLGCKLKGNNGTEGHEGNVAECSCNAVCLQDLVGAMQKFEKKTRQCYSETFDDISSHDFVDMMIADGCFVIELLRLYEKFKNKDGPNVDDPIFTTRWMLPTLRRDLIMLENQLPFFVLQELFDLTRSPEERPLQELAVDFFDPMLPRANAISQIDPDRKYKHLLDLFRFTFIATTKKNFEFLSPHEKVQQPTHSALELKDAGVTFESRDDHELIDIEFQERTLRMPELIINNNTVPVFLNFVAYEQSDEKANSYFTNYFVFLDSLINGKKDVEILRDCGIIRSDLGSDDNVADLIINLCREIVFDSERCHLSVPMKDMNTYWKDRHKCQFLVLCRKKWKKSDKWIVASVIAAVLLLLLTGVQAYYTIISYYEPTEGMVLRVRSS